MVMGPDGSYVVYIALKANLVEAINDVYFTDSEFSEAEPITVSAEEVVDNRNNVLSETQLQDLRAVVVPVDLFNFVEDLRIHILAMLNGATAPIYLHVRHIGLFKLSEHLDVQIRGV